MTPSLDRKILLPLVLILVIVGSFIVSIGLMSSMTSLPTIGKIHAYGLGIYWDSNCSETVYFLDWGTAEPGLTRSKATYIRNEGNAPAVLYLQTANWNPQEASSYITLSWNFKGEAVEPNQVVQVTFTLSISENIEGIDTFAFDIQILQG